MHSSCDVTHAALRPTARAQTPITLSSGLTWTMKSEVAWCVVAGDPEMATVMATLVLRPISKHLLKLWALDSRGWSGVPMHRPFVTTVKFENAAGDVMRSQYAVAAVDTLDAKTELERRFLDLEVDSYTIERIVEATTLQARMLKLPPRCVMLLA
jgi:hypothetical protein